MKRTVFTVVFSMLFLLIAVLFVSAEGEKENPGNWSQGNGMMGGGNSYGMMGGGNSYGMMGGGNSNGMMGGSNFNGMMGGLGNPAGPPSGERLTINDAKGKILDYLSDRRMEKLELNEIMEFQGNFYAQIKETDTGINAFELLIDPYYGYVSSEPGPNMMWNLKYGPMGGSDKEEMPLSEKDAILKAGEFLKNYPSGLVPEDHADKFYGYYTIHTLKDGKVTGMLSVNGYSGDAWYHSWHGPFIQMEEDD